jgi:hypothetical protein
MTVTPTPTLIAMAWFPATATPVLKLLRTPPLNTTNKLITTLAPTLASLPIAPPSCYETAVGTLWCLGIIQNTLQLTLYGVKVRVYLVTADGTAVAQHDTTIARPMLRPGESSPYGVLFDSEPQDVAGPLTVLADSTTVSSDPAYMPLDVTGIQYTNSESVVQIAGTLGNSKQALAQNILLTITLYDAHQRVTGFRQITLSQDLKRGAALPFSVAVIPQGLGTTRVEVVAEGHTS